ncbi:MAG: ATPase domain-containing protein [Methanomassiliicoccus sp.]|nr:ATPase domain-containing protein [Methanomassiliicoccus sp.]
MSDGSGNSGGTRHDLFGINLKQDELAARMGGGLPRGSTMLIEGAEGSGRSALCQRILYGLLQNGHTATFVSTELTLRDFIDQMYSLDYKVDKNLLNGSLSYFPVYPLLGQQRSRGDFLEKLMASPQLYSKDVLFIDSLTTLTKDSLNEANCIRLMGFLKKQMKLEKTIIMTADEACKAADPLRQAVDIYLSIKMKASGSEVTRTVQTLRYQRAKRKVDDTMKIRIEPGIGLVIEITEVSG